jgi:hypothetical protein
VDGESKEVTQGNSYTISGLDVYADTVFYFPKETQTSSVKLSFGKGKLTLNNGQTAKTGQSEDTIEGTLVGLTGSSTQGLSRLTIAVSAKDSGVDYILKDGTFEDPVFGSFKVANGGLTTGTTDSITIDNSGTTAASLKFTDYRGYEKSLSWLYTGTGSWAPALNASSTKTYHVVEGEAVPRNDYVLLTPSQRSEFSHIYQYTTYSSIGSSGAYIELKDTMSGTSQKVYLTDQSNCGGTFYVDGQQYYVNVSSSTYAAYFTWGATANYQDAGTATTLYPLIQAAGGEWIALTTQVTLTNGTTYELPDKASFTYLNTTHNNSAQQWARLHYNISATHVMTIANPSTNVSIYPAVVVLEEEGKDSSNTNVRDAVIAYAADGSGSGVDVAIQTPLLSAATYYCGTDTSGTCQALDSDNSVTEYYDRYGTFVSYDSDSNGLVEITYPDDQAYFNAAIGENPVFATSTSAGGTYKEAVPITNPVAKFASEVPATSSLSQDVVSFGGPCANEFAKKVLNEAWGVTDSCQAYREDSELNANGKGLFEIVEDVFSSGQKALIVSGWTGEDTRNLVDNHLIKPSKMMAMSGAQYKGSVA